MGLLTPQTMHKEILALYQEVLSVQKGPWGSPVLKKYGRGDLDQNSGDTKGTPLA